MGWDKGLDYRKMYRELLRRLREHLGRRAYTSFCYVTILLIQLRNGSRISEALEAARKFIKEGSRKVKVRIRKRSDGHERLMIMPEELKLQDLHICIDILNEDEPKVLNRIKVYAEKVLGINTHSLRYAYITYLLKNGVSPAIVAKITGHKKLDYILTYTQVRTAEEALEKIR